MRIGIVNDMALAREALRRAVESSPGLKAVWAAKDGVEAVQLNEKDPPDLILMDLFMPHMDGAEATRRIMKSRPTPILVVTATVSGNIGKVYEAMGHGALDAVDTPTLGQKGEVEGASRLLAKIKVVERLIAGPVEMVRKEVGETKIISLQPARFVLLGASTGGPTAIRDVLLGMPKPLQASVVVVQHMDAAFAPGLASWLAEHTGLDVQIAKDGNMPMPGNVLVAGTNDHMILDSTGRLRYTAEPLAVVYRPSVDVFFESVARHGPTYGVAVVLTGMGRDGAIGLLRLRKQGWHTIAQDEKTSVVWGMPRAAAETGAAREVLPLGSIAAAVKSRLIPK